MARAVAAGSASPVTSPLAPSARSAGSRPSSSSRQAPTSVETTGMPAAAASRITSGRPSEMLVSTRTSTRG